MIDKMIETFVRIAPYLKDPLVLMGFFLFIAFLFSRYLVKKGIIQPLPRTLGYRILRSILLYGFILGLFIIVLGYVLKRQELIGQQRTAEHFEMLLREAIRDTPGSEGEKGKVIHQIVENYLSGELTKEQVEQIVQDIKVSPTQTNNYPPEHRLSSNQSTSGLQQRSHSTLSNSDDEARTNRPSLTTPAIQATNAAADQTNTSSRREVNVTPTMVRNAVITDDANVACLICGCPVGVTSQELIKKAWDALEANKGEMDPKNSEKALGCTKVAISKYAREADEQQARRLQTHECKSTPTSAEKDGYFVSYWALSDIAAAWFIRGQVFQRQKKCTEAREAYQFIVSKYKCAYIWDRQGWFWNAAQGADQVLKNLETNGCTGSVQ